MGSTTPRRGVRIAAFAAAATVMSPLAMTASAEPPLKLDESKKTYIIQLEADPIATYEGGTAGIPATAPLEGEKVNVRSSHARAYDAHLRKSQTQALRSAGLSTKVKSHEFTVAFNGFTAEITESQAAQLAKAKGVVNVWEDEVRYADTVTTPDYLGMSGDRGVWAQQFRGPANAGKGVVVGVLDTGIDPDNPSFAPMSGATVPAGNWVCENENDPTFECTNKIVGARYYGTDYGNTISYDYNSPRDTNGHGSHTAGTASGNHGVPMTILGNDMGAGSGMAPASHVAVYKALWQTADGNGSGTSAGLVAAINDAVADGVDVINYSVSGSSTHVVTADELAFMAAAEAGVFVSTSAGNSGDTVGVSSVAHNSPWTMTVAASTHDRGVENTLTTGDGTTYEGTGYGGPTEQLPMVLAADIPADGFTAAQADLCGPGSIDDAGAAGKMVVCTRGEHAFVDKGAEVAASGGAAIVVANAPGGASTLLPIMYPIPGFHLTAEGGAALKAYVSGQAEPTGAIGETIYYQAEAPAMASFSSYGPALAGGGDLLKPDITAPGVDVIAAYSQDPETGDPRFESLQGTSMSAPHIAGLGALLRQKYPKWSPMAIKSAMMTTATQTTNRGNPIKWGTRNATPLNYGAGEVVPADSYNPGLVYDSDVEDWFNYACAIDQLQLVGGAQYCAEARDTDPSDLNYPSIAIGDMAGRQVVTRTVKNVTGTSVTYRAKVEAPAGTSVRVEPSSITLAPRGEATFKVIVSRTTAPLNEYTFGAITWVPSNFRLNEVRSPIAIRPVGAAATEEVRGTGVSGSASITVAAGFSGTMSTDVDGLAASSVTPLAPVAAPGTLDDYTFFQVPNGTKVTRVATFGEEVNAGDIDLNVYRLLPGNYIELVGSSGNEDSTEEVTIKGLSAGTYVAAVDNYSGESGVRVPLHVWNVGDRDEGNLTVTPSSVRVTQGKPVTVRASWQGLSANSRYLGQVNFLEGSTVAGSTLVSVNP